LFGLELFFYEVIVALRPKKITGFNGSVLLFYIFCNEGKPLDIRCLKAIHLFLKEGGV
jgi:hypothetical protein